jgi:hypothetical protein
MCLANVKLICQASPLGVNQEIRGVLRLHDKSVKFSCSMTWTCQLPRHWFTGVVIHIDIKSQMRDGVFCEMQVEPKTGGEDVLFRAEKFELFLGCLNKGTMDIRRANAALLAVLRGPDCLTSSLTIFGWFMIFMNFSSSWYSVWRPGYLLLNISQRLTKRAPACRSERIV